MLAVFAVAELCYAGGLSALGHAETATQKELLYISRTDDGVRAGRRRLRLGADFVSAPTRFCTSQWPPAIAVAWSEVGSQLQLQTAHLELFSGAGEGVMA